MCITWISPTPESSMTSPVIIYHHFGNTFNNTSGRARVSNNINLKKGSHDRNEKKKRTISKEQTGIYIYKQKIVFRLKTLRHLSISYRNSENKKHVLQARKAQNASC